MKIFSRFCVLGLIFLLSGIMLYAISNSQINKMFQFMDKNRDFKIVRTEWKGKAKFNDVDANGDGAIDMNEFTDFVKQKAKARDEKLDDIAKPGLTDGQIRTLFDLVDRMNPRGKITEAEYCFEKPPFDKVDKDGNGKITLEEFSNAYKLQTTIKYEQYLRMVFDNWDSASPRGLLDEFEYHGRKDFDRMDKNNDDRLSWKEFAEAYDAPSTNIPEPEPEPEPGSNYVIEDKPRKVLFKLMDWKDPKNEINRSEWAISKNFGSVDKNGNGVITKREFDKNMGSVGRTKMGAYLSNIYDKWNLPGSENLSPTEYHGYIPFNIITGGSLVLEIEKFVGVYMNQAGFYPSGYDPAH